MSDTPPPEKPIPGRSVPPLPDPPPAVRPRPRWLRALGHDDPPARLEAAGQTYERLRIFKHDAFAATALYAAADNPEQRVLGKFARRQSAFGVPMAWLGRWFHEREQRVFRRMADHPLVPDTLGAVTVDGRPWTAAGVRVFVEGKPLEPGDRPNDAFFPQLKDLIAAFHARRVAIVDLHKRDNILIDEDGRPHLMDFQISLAPPVPGEAAGSWAARAPWKWLDWRYLLLGPTQRADVYHLMKNWGRHRADQLTPEQRDLDRYRPWGVRLWRQGIRPVHAARRRLFVALRIRTGCGDAETEIAPDVRPTTKNRRPAPPPRPSSAEPRVAPPAGASPELPA